MERDRDTGKRMDALRQGVSMGGMGSGPEATNRVVEAVTGEAAQSL
jgi:hypothetical protein